MVRSYSFSLTLNDGLRRESLDQQVNCWWRMDVGLVRVRGLLTKPDRWSSTGNRRSASIRRKLEIERRNRCSPPQLRLARISRWRYCAGLCSDDSDSM